MNVIGFVFPGQGSQSIGMMDALAETYPVVRQTFAEASDVLGYDLSQLVHAGPEDELNQTVRTQPAMLAAGVATWRVWQQRTGVPPRYLAGHSLGEYTALVCAGAVSFEDAISVVEHRGQLMQQAVAGGTGAMAAILGLDDEQVRGVCVEAADGEVVEAVNFNSPGQVVIAGHAAAVQRALELAKQAGAKRAIILPVSVPSHCSLMKEAAVELRKRLDSVTFTPPRIPVISNVDVECVRDGDMIRDTLSRQLYQPVRWVEIIMKMSADGVTTVVECGPGKVLAGLCKRIDRMMTALPIVDDTSLAQALESSSGERS